MKAWEAVIVRVNNSREFIFLVRTQVESEMVVLTLLCCQKFKNII